jgi:glycosyltransferase involved in cell wall biosynthesis
MLSSDNVFCEKIFNKKKGIVMQENERFHVLMLPSWYIPEGGQFCRNQAQIVCASGVMCNILANVTLSWKKYKWKAFSFSWRNISSYEDNLLVFRTYFRRLPCLNITNGLLWTWKTMRAFEQYCQIYGKPDLIHVHSVLWGGYAAYRIKKKYGIPYIITEHKGVFGLSCEYAKQQFVDRENIFIKKAFSNANRIITVSDKLTPKIKSFLTSEVLIQTISNVVDTDFFYCKKREASQQIRFVTVNGFLHVKAYDILLPAFDRVCNSLNNCQLIIVGENFDKKEFISLWQKVKHKDNIIFTGELDAFGVRDALWNADIYVIPSRVEAQPVATLEALSTGLPMVGTSVIPEWMLNDKTGIRVSVENIEELALAMITMAKSYQEYDSKYISELINQTASKTVISKQLKEIYLSVIQSFLSK